MLRVVLKYQPMNAALARVLQHPADAAGDMIATGRFLNSPSALSASPRRTPRTACLPCSSSSAQLRCSGLVGSAVKRWGYLDIERYAASFCAIPTRTIGRSLRKPVNARSTIWLQQAEELLPDCQDVELLLRHQMGKQRRDM